MDGKFDVKGDRCGNKYCNHRVIGDGFYCSSCKARMKNSIYGDYGEEST